MDFTKGRKAYDFYNEGTDGLTHDGKPLPKFDEMPERIQVRWQHVGEGFAPFLGENHPFDSREWETICHAKTYAAEFSHAGIPGHGQILLIAKLWALVCKCL